MEEPLKESDDTLSQVDISNSELLIDLSVEIIDNENMETDLDDEESDVTRMLEENQENPTSGPTVLIDKENTRLEPQKVRVSFFVFSNAIDYPFRTTFYTHTLTAI